MVIKSFLKITLRIQKILPGLFISFMKLKFTVIPYLERDYAWFPPGLEPIY